MRSMLPLPVWIKINLLYDIFFIKLHAENNSDFATLSEVSSDAAILSVLLSCTELSETLY